MLIIKNFTSSTITKTINKNTINKHNIYFIENYK